jgi:hypothetical protein
VLIGFAGHRVRVMVRVRVRVIVMVRVRVRARVNRGPMISGDDIIININITIHNIINSFFFFLLLLLY